MDKFLLFFFFMFLYHFGASQKLVEKEIVNPETKFIEINTANCFQVHVDTHTNKHVLVEASMEGEYAEDLAIKIEEEGANILISADFLPSFHAPNDKLSAHKVISISLSITLPDYMKTTILGTNSNVYVKGKYKNLSVTLDDGNCSFDNVSEHVNAKTQKGEIIVRNAKGTVIASSEYGKVQRGKVSKGHEHFNLYSIEGNILVYNN